MAFPADSVAVITQSRFHSLMTFINCCSRMSLAEWESMFGAITEAHPWGVRFWDGFRFWMVNRYKNRMRKYRHLCNLPPDYAYFETPERFSKAQAGRAKNDECNRGSGGLYPCWAWLSEGTETELVYIVCIHICICDSSPWLVHSSGVTFLTAGSSSRRMHPLAGSSSSSSSQPPAGLSASSSLSSPSSELPLSYLLNDTTVIIEDLDDVGEESEEAIRLHDETDVEVFPGGPVSLF